jgi:beta-1,4-mannosyl-glycoprotein beta-1,4-N-acetylglucosaminyltransferase
MKIYDCFTFYNEFDILETKLQEHWDHVDQFVIVEANTTHSGRPKDFFLASNWDRFKPYADKITHIKITDMPGVVKRPGREDDYYPNEKFQRECIVRGLGEARDEDIIFVSDLDEIVRGTCIDFVKNDQQHSLWGFRMPLFNFKFNYMWQYNQPYQTYAQALRVGRLKAQFPNITALRYNYGDVWANRPINYDDGQDMTVAHGGWHFSNIGDTDHVKNKYRSHSHNEMDHMIESIDVDKYIENNKTCIGDAHVFEPVALDEYFPKFIRDNQDKFKDLIIPNQTETVLEKYAKIGRFYPDGLYGDVPQTYLKDTK